MKDFWHGLNVRGKLFSFKCSGLMIMSCLLFWSISTVILMPKVTFPFKKDTCFLSSIKFFFFFPFFSLGAKDSVKHFHVEYTGYSFKFGFNEFSSLKDFVKHFANQPLIGSETGKLCTYSWPERYYFRREGDKMDFKQWLSLLLDYLHTIYNA